jgi:hypothetical protein
MQQLPRVCKARQKSACGKFAGIGTGETRLREVVVGDRDGRVRLLLLVTFGVRFVE